MKKLLKIFSIVVMLFTAIMLIACGSIELSFNEESIELEVGETEQLEYNISNDDIDLVWSVEDDSIVEVDQTGHIKGLKAGTTVITVKAKDKDIEAKITVNVKEKPVVNPTSVIIEGAPNEGKVGESITLTAKVLPAGADQNVTWTSDDEEVATVSDKGVVNLVGIGTVKIKATSDKDSTKFHEVEIDVLAPDPESITITSEDNLTEIFLYESLQFTATVSPDLATKAVVWSVSDNDLASINPNGLLTALLPGTVTVTATSTVNENVTATFELVIVQQEPESINVNTNSVTLDVDGEVTLIVSVEPLLAVQTVEFTSSNEEVATVDENGKIKAVGAGQATITIKSTVKETVTATVTVEVVDTTEIEYDVETVLLDASITAEKYEKITVDGKDFYVGLNAFTNAQEAFDVLEENSVVIVKAGTYNEPTTIKVNGVQIIGPNAGIAAGKDLSNREEEAVFSAFMTLDGVENILIDGIALTGSAQIKSMKPIKNITIQNINSFAPAVPAGEGVIFAHVSNAADRNENITIQNSSFVDTTGASPAGGYRSIRINNANNLTIRDNYFVGFFDTIRLEGEGNAGLGNGVGITGYLKIQDNTFENNFQYPIWIGAFQGADISITDNYLGTYEGYSGVYGYIYIAGFKKADTKSIIDVLRNEMPHKVPGWHQIRFNTNGATADDLEINVNYNIFHQNATDGEDEYYHIADHYADSTFTINGTNNYFLYEGEVKADNFLRVNYEPYFRSLTEEEQD